MTVNNYAVGYTFNESISQGGVDAGMVTLENLTVTNCLAEYNWESGFHFEANGIKTNCNLIDCISNYNGQRFWAVYGYGYMGDPNISDGSYVGQEIYYINCTGTSNRSGLFGANPTPPLLLNGVNDTTVMTRAQLRISSGPSYSMTYANHNFPNFFANAFAHPYPDDAENYNKIPCATYVNSDSYREFFWKYFWIIKNKLGGSITSSTFGTTTTRLNHVRFGPHDAWARNTQRTAFYTYQSELDKLMKHMLNMATYHGVYITYNLGGGTGLVTGDSNDTVFGAGSIFTINSAANHGYIRYCADFINRYGNSNNFDTSHLAMFDLFNEGGTVAQTHNTGWWAVNYPADPGGAYVAWQNDLVSSVKALITIRPVPLLTLGHGSGEATSQSSFNTWSASLDVCNVHPYWSAEDNSGSAFRRFKNWAAALGKPMYIEEWAYNGTHSGEPWLSYWPWADQTCEYQGYQSCVMQLNSMPNPSGTPPNYGVPKPSYPGYPTTQTIDYATLHFFDEVEIAWIAYENPVVSRRTSPTGAAYGGISFY
jgi:hypothetical protein